MKEVVRVASSIPISGGLAYFESHFTQLQSKEGLNGLICKNPFDPSLHLSRSPMCDTIFFSSHDIYTIF